jgi:hypothetical protein
LHTEPASSIPIPQSKKTSPAADKGALAIADDEDNVQPETINASP